MKLTEHFRLMALKVKRKAYEEAHQAFQHDDRLKDRQGERQALDVLRETNHRIREVERGDASKKGYRFKA